MNMYFRSDLKIYKTFLNLILFLKIRFLNNATFENKTQTILHTFFMKCLVKVRLKKFCSPLRT